MKKIICDNRAYEEVLQILGIVPEHIKNIIISNYACLHEENHAFHFCKRDTEEQQEFLLLDVNEDDIWELDKFQSNLIYRKQRVELSGTQLLESVKDDCFIYEKRKGEFTASEYMNLTKLKKYKEEHLQLSKCDVYLLIPGKLEKEESIWDKIPEKECGVYEYFRKKIDNNVNEEYNSEFAKNLSRKCIGEVTLKIHDSMTGEEYYQDALFGIVKHSTGICVLEIMVQNCAIGGNKLLNYYCGGILQYIYKGKEYTLEAFLTQFYIRNFGKKRSMVFSYGDVRTEEIINALANEEFPMGNIRGELQRKVREENIAQYDTAEVYVSEETLFEKCAEINIFGNQRLAYDAIEIFFVEMVLFQDAAVDKVYMNLEEEREKQAGYTSVDEAIARCEEISFDMSQVIHFMDYEQFNFPTVRYSAKRVAVCFGIDKVFEKYEMNRALLDTMIQANKRRVREQQDSIKNRFLFLLSAVTVLGTVGDIFYVLCTDQDKGLFSYIWSFAIITIVFVVYKLTTYILDYITKSRTER